MSTTAPLEGRVFVATADRRREELASALERRGAVVHQAPALSTVSPRNDQDLVRATEALIAGPPEIVVVTTGIGFRSWLEVADAAGLGGGLMACLQGARLIARGAKARGAIQQAGLTPAWVAESETAAEIRDYLLAEGVRGSRIAVQHHGNGSDGLDEAFRAAGAEVQGLVVYRWGPPSDPQVHEEWVRRTAGGECDAVLFTSAPVAHAWLATVVEQEVHDAIRARAARGELLLAGVGPVTAAPLEDFGLPVMYPDRWRLGALIREIVRHYADVDDQGGGN